MERDEEENTETPDPRGALTVPTRAGQMSRQDFSGTSLAVTNAATEALVAQSRAMTEARWIMAMRAPRQMDMVRQDIMAECRVPGFAEVATYSRPCGREQLEEDGPRGKKGEWVEVFAEGLSIRAAEVMMRCMGNMQCKATTLYDDARTRMITVSAVDYQTNATWDIDLTVPKTVERKRPKKGQKPIGERVNSYGDRVFIVEASDQDVATKAAAEISKASRTCILRLVPGQLQDEAFVLCQKIAADKTAKDPNAARRGMLDAFASVGVRPSALEQWLGHELDTMSPAERDQLIQIGKAIKEGDLVWADVIEERLSARALRKPATTPVPSPPATSAPPTGQPTPTGPPPGVPALTSVPPTTAAAAAQPAKPATTSGKGSAALKGALRGNAKPPPAAEAEPGWMSGQPDPDPVKPHLEIPPDLGPPAEGNEYRACGGCGAVIEAPKSDPSGGLCYSCTAAARDAE
jgi:hypothetical protein